MQRNYFRIERRDSNAVLYLGRSSKTLSLRRDVTRNEVRNAIDDLPSGTHDRRRLVNERLRAAGLVG